MCHVPAGALLQAPFRTAARRRCVVAATVYLGCRVCCPGWAAPSPEQSDPVAQPRQRICLNGVWQFKAAGATEDAIPDGGWTETRVPSSWRGWSTRYFTISDADSKSALAWYRRSFAVPESWSDGRRVKLRFQAVDWAHRILVNGQQVHESDFLGLCFDVDITGQVRFGERNDLAVLVKLGPPQRKNSPDGEAGIIRSVYLTSRPPVHVVYAHVLPSVRERKLTVVLRVRNEDDAEQTVTVGSTVRDNGRSVLELPARTVTLAPGATTDIRTEKRWDDPVLWGFGEYGRPHLYHLETTLTGAGVVDRTFDRFGFREFRAEGKRFLLNEKPIFIKGDLINRCLPFTDHPAFVAAFYQALRSDNVHLQRMHSGNANNFESRYWYEVADELGHLVQTQFQPRITKAAGEVDRIDHPRILALWTAYVNDHFNHPGLVMWCPDNERFTAPLPIENCVNTVMEAELGQWNTLTSHIRRLDPMRPVNYEHGWALYAAVLAGSFDAQNYMVFNIHPYGRLGEQVDRARAAVDFAGSAPVLVGEIFDFPRQIDLLQDPVGSYLDQRRRGKVFAKGILDVAGHGAAGVILCALQRAGFVGYTSPRGLHLGPWSDLVTTREDGEITGHVEGRIQPAWPSLSGEGTKVEFIDAVYGVKTANAGYGQDINWFDPTRPVATPTITNELVREAYRKVDGRNESGLGPERAAEVVVCFGENGRPVEGAYVYLVPEQGQAPPAAVATDPDGTAWFRLWDEGRYGVVVRHAGRNRRRGIDVRRPAWDGKPGYGHIQWVDMGGIDVGRRKAALAAPAQLAQSSLRLIDQVLSNGDLELWPPSGWSANDSVSREDQIRHSGKHAARLTGHLGQFVQRVQMKPGVKYRVSAAFCKISGHNYGQIGIRTSDYKWLCHLKGSKTEGEWTSVETEYVADGTEFYFYCLNYYMGEDGVCIYDDISIREIGPAVVEEDPEPDTGPFRPDADGFVRDWLVCGPFPNRPTGDTWEAFEADALTAAGGEQRIEPAYGMTHDAPFPDSDYWLKGTVVCRWRDVHSAGPMVLPEGVAAPSIGLRGTAENPSNYIGCYAACYVHSDRDREVTVAVGSDDGHKVWLNHEPVGADPTTHAARPDQFKYPARLRKGRNVLVVEVLQAIGAYKFCLRFLDGEGPVTDLTVLLAPKGK